MGCKKSYIPIYTCQHCGRHGELFNRDCPYGDFVLRGVHDDGSRIHECRHMLKAIAECQSAEARSEADKLEVEK